MGRPRSSKNTKSSIVTTFLTRLVQRQTALGLSDRQLAKLVRIDSTTLSRWKRHQGTPRLDDAARIASASRCTLTWMLGEGRAVEPSDDIDPTSYQAGYRAALRDARAALRRSQPA
jgi:transcriptional regulator with XRE-family HTH domain